MGVRIILADDHTLMRQALRVLLEDDSYIEVVGEAGDGHTALEVAASVRPDIALIDISMPGLNGIDTARKLLVQQPGIRVIALSAHFDSKLVFQMIKAGALGYLLKDCALEELSCAIRTVMKGQLFLSPSIVDVVVKDYMRHAPSLKDTSVFSSLTGREREVLQLLSEGNSTKQTALRLKVSVKTVETHRKQIMDKLDIRSVAELTKYAIREGLTSA